MNTSVRNHTLAKAVKRIGAIEVALRLGISETALLLYSNNELMVPNDVWTLVIQEGAGLIEIAGRLV